MTLAGADLAQLDDLSRRFLAWADQVTSLQAEVTGAVNALVDVAWTGQVARAFRDQWNGEFSASLSRLAEALDGQAAFVLAKRDEFDRVANHLA